MKVEVQLHGVDGVIATLQSLPAEVVSKRGGPVKLALRKGARVILKAEKDRLRALMGHQVNDEHREASGLLLKNLVATRGKAPLSGKGERYLVRVKRKTYPGRKGKKPVHTVQTAQLMEYGSRGGRQPAESFIRTAFKAHAQDAIQTIEKELLLELDKVVKKLAAQNKGK